VTIRVATIEVSHWHALNDAAYLRHLIAMPDVELVAIQDSDASLVAQRAAEVGSPPTFTNYRQMLSTTRPDFVVALGRHRQMAGIAHDLLDEGYPFLMEKPMGINAPEVEGVAEKAARLNAFIAVPLAQMSSRRSQVRRMQIDDLVDRRQNYRHQWRIVLRGFDRRPPHSFVQATYLGEQGLNLLASFATQQLDPVGGVLSQRRLQFAALRFSDSIGSQVCGAECIRLFYDDI